jgi:hypothetical protein
MNSSQVHLVYRNSEDVRMNFSMIPKAITKLNWNIVIFLGGVVPC